MELTAIVEALIFAAPEPVSTPALLRCLRGDENRGPADGPGGTPVLTVTARAVEEAVAELNRSYEAQGHAFRIVAEAGGWRFLSHPDFAPWIERLLPGQKPSRLSPAALETLAIIAYRQPVTKSAVESIRGVGIDGVLQTVLERGLVRPVGRAPLPGRPVLYGTTDIFLKHFGIRNLDDLPNAAELRFAAQPAFTDSRNPGKEEQTEEELVLDALPRTGDNGGSEAPKRLSPVAAARKLAENQKSFLKLPNHPTHPDYGPDSESL